MTIGEVSPPNLAMVNYADMTPKVIGESALRAGAALFDFFVGKELATWDSLVTRDSLHIRLMTRERDTGTGEYREIGTYVLGPEGHQFADNTAGKAVTAAEYSTDSDNAVRLHGLDMVADGNADDPRGWTGGVYHLVRTTIGRREYTLEVVVACSGVQGVFDKAVGYCVATTYGAIWTEHMKALYGAN